MIKVQVVHAWLQTVFIEPMGWLILNNEIRELTLKEKSGDRKNFKRLILRIITD